MKIPIDPLTCQASSRTPWGRYPNDDDLDHYIDEIGCAYNTALYPGGVRAWLTEISRRIEAWLASPGA